MDALAGWLAGLAVIGHDSKQIRQRMENVHFGFLLLLMLLIFKFSRVFGLLYSFYLFSPMMLMVVVVAVVGDGFSFAAISGCTSSLQPQPNN